VNEFIKLLESFRAHLKSEPEAYKRKAMTIVAILTMLDAFCTFEAIGMLETSKLILLQEAVQAGRTKYIT